MTKLWKLLEFVGWACLLWLALLVTSILSISAIKQLKNDVGALRAPTPYEITNVVDAILEDRYGKGKFERGGK